MSDKNKDNNILESLDMVLHKYKVDVILDLYLFYNWSIFRNYKFIDKYFQTTLPSPHIFRAHYQGPVILCAQS